MSFSIIKKQAYFSGGCYGRWPLSSCRV